MSFIILRIDAIADVAEVENRCQQLPDAVYICLVEANIAQACLCQVISFDVTYAVYCVGIGLVPQEAVVGRVCRFKSILVSHFLRG